MTTDTRSTEQIFDAVWRPLVSDNEGHLIEDRVADELFDYYHTRQRMSRLLGTLTRGRLTDPETPWFVIEQYIQTELPKEPHE